MAVQLVDTYVVREPITVNILELDVIPREANARCNFIEIVVWSPAPSVILRSVVQVELCLTILTQLDVVRLSVTIHVSQTYCFSWATKPYSDLPWDRYPAPNTAILHATALVQREPTSLGIDNDEVVFSVSVYICKKYLFSLCTGAVRNLIKVIKWISILSRSIRFQTTIDIKMNCCIGFQEKIVVEALYLISVARERNEFAYIAIEVC